MAGLLLPFLSHVLPSPQDSFLHSLFYPGQRFHAEVLACPTPSVISLLKDPPRIGQAILLVMSHDSVLKSIGYTIPCCRDVQSSIQIHWCATWVYRQPAAGDRVPFSVMTVWVDQMLKGVTRSEDSKYSLWREAEEQCLHGLV